MKDAPHLLPHVRIREQLEDEYCVTLPVEAPRWNCEDLELIERMLSSSPDELVAALATIEKFPRGAPRSGDKGPPAARIVRKVSHD